MTPSESVHRTAVCRCTSMPGSASWTGTAWTTLASPAREVVPWAVKASSGDRLGRTLPVPTHVKDGPPAGSDLPLCKNPWLSTTTKWPLATGLQRRWTCSSALQFNCPSEAVTVLGCNGLKPLNLRSTLVLYVSLTSDRHAAETSR